MDTMEPTVTIDKAYFETLLRRAEFHTSGRDLSTPIDIQFVSIPKIDHDNLLCMAQEYTSLKEALYNGGIQPETLEILIRGGNVQSAPTATFDKDENDGHESSGPGLFSRPSQARVTLSRTSFQPWSEAGADWRPTNTGGVSQTFSKGKGEFLNRNNSYTQEDDVSWDPDLDKDNDSLAVPRIERKRYAREEQRTIIAKNLSDRATHKDITNFVRGGLVLDVYLRTNDRSASISFVEASAALDFMNHVKKTDIYVHGKRLEFAWNDRQFILPGHVANKIGIGATRNLVIRNVHPNITKGRLREDLDHIHNLVIIDIIFQSGNAYLQLNSVHNSLFAKTCMMSRATYKGMRIEWYPDECAQPLPKLSLAPKKENKAPSPTKKASTMMNRFAMLNMDGDGTQDSSEDDNDRSILQDFSNMHINRSSPWNARTVAA